MRRKRLTRQLFPLYLTITLISLAAIGLIAAGAVRQFYYDQTATELTAIANLVKQQVKAGDDPFVESKLDSLSKLLGKLSSSRITFIRSDGLVFGDTEEDPAVMENHADRPEFKAAMEGRTGISTRYSPTLGNVRMYLAIAIDVHGSPVGVVRISRSVDAINASLETVYIWILGGIAMIAVFAALLSFIVSRRFTRPLLIMEKGANQFAAGDLSHRMIVPKTEELARLSEALNQMATQLEERIQTITEQRNEREAILESMVEGVLAIDLDEHILNMNRSAGDLLGIDPSNYHGLSTQEAVMNPDFNRFVSTVVNGQEKREAEIVVSNGKDRYLQVYGTFLENADGQRIGVLVVLNDVTQLRKLENHRKEFVANVSHELRTPITSIKGFVETLKDGAIDTPGDADRFLEIILRHADRLNAIVEDLLSLSNIEREVELDEIPLENFDIGSVLEQSLQTILHKAKKRSIQIKSSISENTFSLINPPLLEQALVNLLDNAINYSDEGGEISVGIERCDNQNTIIISDSGCGISAEHIPRIFERFYRADKDRSRKVGGTGLGLAIVKHIVLAHGGQITVDSTPGQGSTFKILLPKSNIQP